MTRWIAFAGVVLLGIAAIAVSERRKVDAEVSPAAILYLVADSEQELTRMPTQFTRLSDQEEIQIGDELARYYVNSAEEERREENADIQNYIADVGKPLTDRAHRRLPYRFHYIADRNMINAFALPGGHVFVGGGLLTLMDSEDQLAAVLGHEIEHIDHYHCADRVQREQAMRKLPLGGLVAIPVEVFAAGYSKDQEMEADREGTRLAVQSGYSASGAIRLFEIFQRLYEETQGRAKTPDRELNEIARQTLEGYFRSHPLPSERVAQIQKLIASEGWLVRAERNLGVAYVYMASKAQHALNGGQYEQAAQIATQALKQKPDLERALIVLAQSQFMLADFSASVATYRKLLDSRPNDSVARAYARSLAAADRHSAAAEFRRWFEAHRNDVAQEGEALLAGLELLNGNTTEAHNLEIRPLADQGDDAPLRLGELGWWYYQAGDYAHAQQLLDDALQLRPGNPALAMERMWTQIDNHRLKDALEGSNNFYDETMKSEHLMAQAVAQWQARDMQQALLAYRAAIDGHSEWLIPKWYRAIYSPLAVRSIEEIQVRDEKERKASSTQPRDQN